MTRPVAIECVLGAFAPPPPPPPAALTGSMNIIRITNQQIMHNRLCANITSFRCDVSTHDLHAFNKLQLLYKVPLVAIGPRLNSSF